MRKLAVSMLTAFVFAGCASGGQTKDSDVAPNDAGPRPCRGSLGDRVSDTRKRVIRDLVAEPAKFPGRHTVGTPQILTVGAEYEITGTAETMLDVGVILSRLQRNPTTSRSTLVSVSETDAGFYKWTILLKIHIPVGQAIRTVDGDK